MSESIYSLFLHIQSPGYAVHSSFSEGLSIMFPNLTTKAIIGHDDIYLNAVPALLDNTEHHDCFIESSSSEFLPGASCRHITQFQNDVSLESRKVDNLLATLRQYYKEIKTKRQLNLEVPAGFRQDSNNLEKCSLICIISAVRC